MCVCKELVEVIAKLGGGSIQRSKERRVPCTYAFLLRKFLYKNESREYDVFLLIVSVVENFVVKC